MRSFNLLLSTFLLFYQACRVVWCHHRYLHILTPSAGTGGFDVQLTISTWGFDTYQALRGYT